MELQLPEGQAAVRLDRLLVELGLAGSRRQAQKLIERGAIRAGGRRLKKGDVVGPEDRLEVDQAELGPQVLKANPAIALSVLYADSALVVVAKPGGIPCHPLNFAEDSTLMNGVVALYPETASVGFKPLEGGLVHRLDNGSSGAVMVARNLEALTELRRKLRSGEITRIYEALVCGRLVEPLEIRTPIAHHPTDPRRMVLLSEGAKRWRGRPQKALSYVEPVWSGEKYTLVRIKPLTGVRHQIRLHLAGVGLPLVGDTLYGSAPLPLLAPGRIFLHLRSLALISPTGAAVDVEAPLPTDLQTVLKQLKLMSGDP